MPCLVAQCPQTMQIDISRSDLVLISFWSSPSLGLFGLVVSNLVLQACISFERDSDKIGSLLFFRLVA